MLSALDVNGCEGCSASGKGALDEALTWLGRAGVMRSGRAGFPGGALGVSLTCQVSCGNLLGFFSCGVDGQSWGLQEVSALLAIWVLN